MHFFLLLGCFLLATTEYLLGSAHMIPDERLSTNKVMVSNIVSQSLDIASPPVVIVELPKSVKSKRAKKQKQKKQKKKARRPRPPANCVPLWGSCKSSGNVCCDFCAFCQCRLFRTVCICRMGNPRC